jgi:hypothetical protein
MSFACGACSEPNLVHIAKETFYVVTAGTSIGIFRDPVSFSFCIRNGLRTDRFQALADSFVTGVKCSSRKKYPSLEAAIAAFQAALVLDNVKILSKD